MSPASRSGLARPRAGPPPAWTGRRDRIPLLGQRVVAPSRMGAPSIVGPSIGSVCSSSAPSRKLYPTTGINRLLTSLWFQTWFAFC